MRIRLLNGDGGLPNCLNRGHTCDVSWWILRDPFTTDMLIILLPSGFALDSIWEDGAYSFVHPYNHTGSARLGAWRGILHPVYSIGTSGVHFPPFMRDGVFLRFPWFSRVIESSLDGGVLSGYRVNAKWVRYTSLSEPLHVHIAEDRMLTFCAEAVAYLCGYISERVRIRAERESLPFSR